MAAGLDQLGIEQLSVFGLPPVEFVNLAADLGCRYISTALTAIAYNPHGYAPFSLRDDAALRRAMLAAMDERDVSISLGEEMCIRDRAQQDNGQRKNHKLFCLPRRLPTARRLWAAVQRATSGPPLLGRAFLTRRLLGLCLLYTSRCV